MYIVSVVMKGKQMVPVLNSLDIKCAVYGNHDFGTFAALADVKFVGKCKIENH